MYKNKNTRKKLKGKSLHFFRSFYSIRTISASAGWQHCNGEDGKISELLLNGWWNTKWVKNHPSKFANKLTVKNHADVQPSILAAEVISTLETGKKKKYIEKRKEKSDAHPHA